MIGKEPSETISKRLNGFSGFTGVATVRMSSWLAGAGAVGNVLAGGVTNTTLGFFGGGSHITNLFVDGVTLTNNPNGGVGVNFGSGLSISGGQLISSGGGGSGLSGLNNIITNATFTNNTTGRTTNGAAIWTNVVAGGGTNWYGPNYMPYTNSAGPHPFGLDTNGINTAYSFNSSGANAFDTGAVGSTFGGTLTLGGGSAQIYANGNGLIDLSASALATGMVPLGVLPGILPILSTNNGGSLTNIGTNNINTNGAAVGSQLTYNAYGQVGWFLAGPSTNGFSITTNAGGIGYSLLSITNSPGLIVANIWLYFTNSITFTNGSPLVTFNFGFTSRTVPGAIWTPGPSTSMNGTNDGALRLGQLWWSNTTTKATLLLDTTETIDTSIFFTNPSL